MATNPLRTFPVSRAGHVLILNAGDHVLTELSLEPCAIVAQQVLSETDIDLLLPLLESYPTYAPHALLLSATNGEPLDQAASRINDALEHRQLNMVTKPVRQGLARIRMKLAPFGLVIQARPGLGYELRLAEKGHEQGVTSSSKAATKDKKNAGS